MWMTSLLPSKGQWIFFWPLKKSWCGGLRNWMTICVVRQLIALPLRK